MIDQDRLVRALLTLMGPGNSEEPYDGPTGRWVIGEDLDEPTWTLWSAQDVAREIVDAYEKTAPSSRDIHQR